MAYWTLPDGRKIALLTLAEFNALPDGVPLLCIDGTVHTKGVDTDDDTRAGFVAFGLPEKEEE